MDEWGTLPTDAECVRFLHALDNAFFEVTDFEATFIGSHFTKTVFSDKCRARVVRMMEKYRGQINW